MKGKVIINRIRNVSVYLLSYAEIAAVFHLLVITTAVKIMFPAVQLLNKGGDWWKLLGSYLNTVTISPGLSLIKDFGREVKESSEKNGEGIPNRLRGIRAQKDIILFISKIIGIQRKVYSMMFALWFKIECTDKELDILSRHSSPAGIGMEIAERAGVSGKREFSRGDLERLRFAYRTSIRVLQVHLKLAEHDPDVSDVPFNRRIKKLYPDIVAVRQTEIEGNRIFMAKRHVIQRIKAETEYIRFSNYLHLQIMIITEKKEGEKNG